MARRAREHGAHVPALCLRAGHGAARRLRQHQADDDCRRLHDGQHDHRVALVGNAARLQVSRGRKKGSGADRAVVRGNGGGVEAAQPPQPCEDRIGNERQCHA